MFNLSEDFPCGLLTKLSRNYLTGPQRGIIFLADMAGGRLMHLSKAKLKVVRMGLRFALDGSPVRIVAFHVLNAVPFYHLIMQLMRPWARKELKDLVKHLKQSTVELFQISCF